MLAAFAALIGTTLTHDATIIPAEDDDDELLDAHRTSMRLFPPQLAALSLIWNKPSTTCTLPLPHLYLLIPFFILPFPVCPLPTHDPSSPLISKTFSLSWIDTS